MGSFQIPESPAILRPRMEDDPIGNEPKETGIVQYVQAILNHNSIPPCVIVDEDLNVVYVHGRTGNFLEPAEGGADPNILKMAREGLQAELAEAIQKTCQDRQQHSLNDIEIGSGSTRIRANVIFKPLYDPVAARSLTLVVFDELDSGHGRAKIAPSNKTVRELELSLQDAREHLQSVMEEMQAANEELKSTNEELQSTNEELQSTNEELETSKEELQSLNEESNTVNAELQSRIDDLSRTTDDLNNLMHSTEIAVVFLDSELRIRNYTPRAVDLIRLEATDRGRPIGDLATNLNPTVDLTTVALKVLDDLSVQEIETNVEGLGVYLLKARPYRTIQNMIDGVVLTFENVTRLKEAELKLGREALQVSDERLLSVVAMSGSGIVLADPGGNVKGVNHAFCKMLGYSEAELLTQNVADFTHPDSWRATETHLSAARDAGPSKQPATFEKTFLRKDGSSMKAQVTITWQFDAKTSMQLNSIAFVQVIAD